MGLGPATARRGGHQQHGRSLSLAWPRPPQDTCHPSSGPASHLLGRLALLPSNLGLGLECCAWGEGSLGSKPHPLQQPGRGWLPESVQGLGGRTHWPPATICPCLSVPPGRRAHHFSARDQVTQDSGPFAHPGAKDLHWPHLRGWTPGSQCRQEKETDPRTNRRETELGTLRPLSGGQSGRQGGGSLWSLANTGAYCRGSLGLTLAPALEMQAGMVGQTSATPSRAFPGPLFPELWAGFSWAAVGLTQPPWAPRKRQPGKWDMSGWPRGSSNTLGSTLTCPPNHLGLFHCLVGTWLPKWSQNLWMPTRGAEGSPPVCPPHHTRNTWEPAWLHYLQPLVNTLGMELMVAGEDPEQLPRLEVTEADDTPGRRTD